MNWQPIATAPKDRPIMVWIAGDWKYPSHAQWGGSEWSLYEKNEGHLSGDDLITHWDEVPEGPEATLRHAWILGWSVPLCGDKSAVKPSDDRFRYSTSTAPICEECMRIDRELVTGTTNETRQGVARAKDETL